MLKTCVVIIVLIIVLIYFFSSKTASTMNCLSGMWLAEEEFCDDAGIDIMTLYIDPDLKTYWITIKNSTINASHVGSVKITNKSPSKHCTEKECEFTIEFSLLPTSMKDVFAAKQTIRFNTVTNKIRLYNDDTVYFQGYKDAKLTSAVSLEKIK